MSLSSHKVRPSIAVSDMARAREFYEGKLDLSAREEQSDDSRIYACASGVTFEHFDDSTLKTDQKGIHELAEGRVAWFKDPDGNTLAIEQ
jgi:predicted enzyme related to lactoylglutathione lyase